MARAFSFATRTILCAVAATTRACHSAVAAASAASHFAASRAGVASVDLLSVLYDVLMRYIGQRIRCSAEIEVPSWLVGHIVSGCAAIWLVEVSLPSALVLRIDFQSKHRSKRHMAYVNIVAK